MGDQAKTTDCTAVILAGGRNSRMDGQNKAFLNIGGSTILERLLAVCAPLFKEILLVTRTPEQYANCDVTIVTDLFRGRSSLTGIHAGLVHAPTPHAFVLRCDAPFIDPKVVRLLLDARDAATDIVVPFVDGFYQPLCAIYSKRCIAPIEAQLRDEDFKIIHFYDQMVVRKISAQAIRAVDPQMRSFFNVNTPQALIRSQKLTTS